MLNSIIRFSLQHRLLVVALAMTALGYGGWELLHLPIDVFPDLNRPRVTVMTDRDTGRSRGFGFVEMANDAEGQRAIAAINGTDLDGRTLNVNEARPKAERSSGGGGGFGRKRW